MAIELESSQIPATFPTLDLTTAELLQAIVRDLKAITLSLADLDDRLTDLTNQLNP